MAVTSARSLELREASLTAGRGVFPGIPSWRTSRAGHSSISWFGLPDRGGGTCEYCGIPEA
jgi:hypothetical protein